MAELRADLALDTTDAESSIDSLGPLFDEMTSGFAAGLSEALNTLTEIAPPDIDASAIEASLAAAGESGAESISAALDGVEVEPLVIDADTAPAVDAISSIEAEPVELEVTADTSDAAAAVDDLGSSAADATGSVGGLGDASGAMGAAAGLAAGDVGSLSGVADQLGGKMGIAGGAIIGASAAVGIFFNEAVDALGATQRFEQALGPMADEVENLKNIEGLNTDLSQLALQLGSDDDKIRTVAARMFELGTASGKTREESSLFTQQLVAMGARAVALNPQLGDVGDVTDALSTALVRGGRFASKYGLDLNQAEINARALELAHKDSVEELSFVEKAMGGASLASEKYGKGLDEIVARGAENATTTQRRLKQEVREVIEGLGAPLVAPIFELMEQARPSVQAIGTAFGHLASSVLPSVIAIVEGLVPILEVMAATVGQIPGPVLAAGLAWKAWGPLGALLPILAAIDPDLARIAVTLAGIIGVIFAAAKAWQALQLSFSTSTIGLVIGGVALLAGALGIFGDASQEAEAHTRSFTDALVENQGALDDSARSAARALFEERNQLDDLADAGVKFNKVLEATNEATPETVDALSELQDVSTKYAGSQRLLAQEQARVIEKIRESDPALARQLTQLSQAGTLNLGLIGTIRELAKAREEADATNQNREDAGARDIDIKQQQTDATAAHQAAVEAETAAQERAAAALDSFVSAALGKLPTAADAFKDVQSSAEDVFAALDPARLIEKLQENIAAVANFRANLATLFQGGFSEIAAFAIELGPQAGGAFINGVAQGIRDGQPEQALALEATLGQQRLGTQALEDQIRNEGGPAIDEAWLEFHAKFPGISRDALASADAAYLAMGPQIGGSAAAVAGNAATQFKGGVDTTPGFTQDALAGVVGVLNQAYSIVGSPARIAGLTIGGQLGEGIHDGLAMWDRLIAMEAEQIIRNAEQAARREAQSQSPSQLFADLGADLALGMAEGIEAQTKAVQLSMREVVLATASAATGGTTGGVSSQQISFNVEVHGVTDPAVARQVGQQIGNGAVDALTRRGVVVAARTN